MGRRKKAVIEEKPRNKKRGRPKGSKNKPKEPQTVIKDEPKNQYEESLDERFVVSQSEITDIDEPSVCAKNTLPRRKSLDQTKTNKKRDRVLWNRIEKQVLKCYTHEEIALLRNFVWCSKKKQWRFEGNCVWQRVFVKGEMSDPDCKDCRTADPLIINLYNKCKED